VKMGETPRLPCLTTPDGGELRFASFAEHGEQWIKFAAQIPDATLYHSRPWVELLRAAHGIKILVATLEYRSGPVAGCLFARPTRPFARRLISLPDSEHCGPLAKDEEARNAFLSALASHPRARAGFEIHGAPTPPTPWETVDTFAQWTVEMQRPLEKLHQALDRDVRRNMRHAVEAGIAVERGDSLAYLRRFYRLHLDTRRRLGVPPRPFRYFKLLHQIFSRAGALSVWIARLRDNDLAGLVMLQDGDALYAKMNARSIDCPNGANHLMFVSAMDAFAGRVRRWDLGRVDVRNRGLRDFKKRLGATSTPLPYAYFPRAPRNISSEVLSGPTQILSQAWRRLPLWTTRVLGTVVYGFLV
jgi:hypothetical protein